MRPEGYSPSVNTVGTYVAAPERRKRDTQGLQVWAALRTMDQGRVLSTRAGVFAYAKRVASSKWWKDHDGPHVDSLVLTSPPTTELLLLKRLSHHLVPDKSPWHGPEWTQIFLSIVGRFMGVAKRKEVRAAFKEHKVKSRQLSPEAKEAAKRRRAAADVLAMMKELSNG